MTQSYRERDVHTFGTLIPETALRNGSNVVFASVIEAPAQYRRAVRAVLCSV